MGSLSIRAIFAAIFLAGGPAVAGPVDIAVTDTSGHPAANTVVVLRGDAATDNAALSKLPSEAVVDQRHEMFIPLVSIVRRGGRAIFTNHDTTMHQVYSFSPIKQFEFEIDEGQRSAPVVFDRAGIASIGCNIHDQMITYVFVADSPWTVLTDADGHAHFSDIPAGSYRAEIWNPQSVLGSAPPVSTLNVTASPVKLVLQLGLSSAKMPGMNPKHSSQLLTG